MSSDRRTTDNQIPQFPNREAEAAFWDSHDFADYWDALQPVSVSASHVYSVQQTTDDEQDCTEDHTRTSP